MADDGEKVGRLADWNSVNARNINAPQNLQPGLMVGVDGRASIDSFDSNDTPYLNRELSWLAFNGRVLAIAKDPSIPLLERVRFLSIYSSNLDEFFQVRVAGLKDQVAGELSVVTPDGRSPAEQLTAIAEAVRAFNRDKREIFRDLIRPALLANDISILRVEELAQPDVDYLSELFQSRIFPVLTPLALAPSHPFPYISDLSLNLVASLRDSDGGSPLLARLKVPDTFARFLALPGKRRTDFVLLEDVIRHHLDVLFPGMSIEATHFFRVTRNADLTYEDEEADDLLSAVEMELRRRRFGRAIRLEVSADIDESILGLLLAELGLEAGDVYVEDTLLDMTGLDHLANAGRLDLEYPSWTPVTPPAFRPVDDERVDLFARLASGDVLLHHPYESFSVSVAELIHQAAIDDKVLAIKMTLYRTSGDSPIIDSLVRAADAGKQVAVLIELKARFDEQANIEWARRLEQAGAHVSYGLAGLKIHSKTIMIVRDEGQQIRRYCHVGTGNYNHRTARYYEDLGLLSADEQLGDDLANLFNQLTGYGRDLDYQRLLVAPDRLRSAITGMVDAEAAAGPNGRIVMKMNSLVDSDLIDHLYKASQRGVQIDLIVRGICGLRPGLAGRSDNIRVRSIVGRFLEHSRLYYFANGDGPGSPSYFIGSADMMPRNLDRRVEVLASVYGQDLQSKIDVMLDVSLDDDQLSWTLHHDGSWSRSPSSAGSNAHELFQHMALAAATPRLGPERADR